MLSYELRERVLDYINNIIDLESLQDWYVPRLRQFLQDPNSADAKVVSSLELSTAHLAAKIDDEEEIKDMLWDILAQFSEVMYRDLTEQRSSHEGGNSRVTTTSTTSNVVRETVIPLVTFPTKSFTFNFQ